MLLSDAQLTALVHTVNTNTDAASYYATVVATATAALSAPPIANVNCTVAGACRGPLFGDPQGNYLDAGGFESRVLALAFVHRFEAANASYHSVVAHRGSRSAPTASGSSTSTSTGMSETRTHTLRGSSHGSSWHATTTTSAATPSKWSDRAVVELQAAAALPSWQWPVGQALEHSTMTFGMAIGFDWLYAVLTPSQRAMAANATLVLGVREQMRSFHEALWHTHDIGNWVLVTNGGMVASTIAVADEGGAMGATMSNYVFTHGLNAMRGALASFAPFGVWPEGPGYRNYAMQYVTRAAATLQGALGSDYGIMASPGMEGTGIYDFTMHGPSGTFFNWADCHAEHNSPTTLFFLGTTFKQPVLAAAARSVLTRFGGADVETLVHFSDAGSDADIGALPLNRVYTDPSSDRAYGRKKHVGFFRSCWLCDPSDAAWAGFKGGENVFDDHGSDSHNNHGHLDVGNFVLEMKGVRWAVELGPGQYDYPDIAYFGRFRFSYYKTSSQGHNVLSFDGETQSRVGSGAIEDGARVNTTEPMAVINVTDAYAAGGAAAVARTVSFERNYTAFVVNDTWSHEGATTATWQMHTFATAAAPTVRADGAAVVTLSEAGKTLTMAATAADGTPVSFSVTQLELAPPQDPTVEGKVVRVVSLDVPAASGGVAVVFE